MVEFRVLRTGADFDTFACFSEICTVAAEELKPQPDTQEPCIATASNIGTPRT